MDERDLLLPAPFTPLANGDIYVTVEPGPADGDFERWRYHVLARYGSLSATLDGTYCVRSTETPEEKRRAVTARAIEMWNNRDLDWCFNENDECCRNFVCSKCRDSYEKGTGEPNPRFCPSCGRPVRRWPW